MAKKKQTENGDDVKFDAIAKIRKDFGDVLRPANEILDKKLEVFSSGSASLDFALGGGAEEGSLIEMSGLPKVGKSSLFLQWLVSYQKAGRDTYYIDAENRFGTKQLQIHGLDPTKLILIRSEGDKILDANDTLDLIEILIRNKPGCAIVLDSASTLCSRERATSKVDAQRRDTTPKLFSDFIVGVSPHIRINRVSLFVIRHVGMNQSPGAGEKYIASGGLKWDFRKDISLKCTWSEKWEEPKGEYIGKKLHIKVISSNFKPPVDKVDTYLRFAYGIDIEKETVQMAMEYGLLEKVGNWLTLNVTPEPVRLNGEAQMSEYLRQNPEAFQLLTQQIKDLFT